MYRLLILVWISPNIYIISVWGWPYTQYGIWELLESRLPRLQVILTMSETCRLQWDIHTELVCITIDSTERKPRYPPRRQASVNNIREKGYTRILSLTIRAIGTMESVRFLRIHNRTPHPQQWLCDRAVPASRNHGTFAVETVSRHLFVMVAEEHNRRKNLRLGSAPPRWQLPIRSVSVVSA